MKYELTMLIFRRTFYKTLYCYGHCIKTDYQTQADIKTINFENGAEQTNLKKSDKEQDLSPKPIFTGQKRT